MELVRIQSSDDRFFSDSMEIYKYSFPIEETRTYEDHLDAMNDDMFHYDMIVENNNLIGFMAYWVIDDLIYLEHFAIDKNKRGMNYGKKSLSLLKNMGKKIILEIEEPVDQITNRRRRFYESQGFTMNTFNHIPLSYRAGNPQGKLLIMTYPNTISEYDYDKFKKIQDKRIMSYTEKL